MEESFSPTLLLPKSRFLSGFQCPKRLWYQIIFEGVRWLDSLAGEPVEPQEGEITLPRKSLRLSGQRPYNWSFPPKSCWAPFLTAIWNNSPLSIPRLSGPFTRSSAFAATGPCGRSKGKLLPCITSGRAFPWTKKSSPTWPTPPPKRPSQNSPFEIPTSS